LLGKEQDLDLKLSTCLQQHAGDFLIYYLWDFVDIEGSNGIEYDAFEALFIYY